MKPDELRTAMVSREKEVSLSLRVLTDLLRTVLEKGVPCRFRARGFSMSPFIKDDDVVTVFPFLGETPRLGDVVAFIHPVTDGLVIHRVVGSEGSSCLIRGDNSPEEDGWVPATRILGRVNRVEREGKRIALGLGPERWLLGVLARGRILFPLMLSLRRLVHPWLVCLHRKTLQAPNKDSEVVR